MITSGVGICVRFTPDRGRGVFATKQFEYGDLIEKCPVIILPFEDCEKIRETTISDYWFAWNKEKGSTAICLGFGSLYNHSIEPNAVFDQDLSERTISIYALKTIEPDEEILFNYNQRTHDKRKWYFEVQGAAATKAQQVLLDADKTEPSTSQTS
eukprot:TRINITY_DN13883_c0_g1_i1.p2 TRINITY_DN13883_c0_g1~~TRINITY_DN13883_c0_g1_i1.p2  ORF type:complete len:155 (-),score=18.91 TRINITY_DN13883_c0_g1_i1:562-1026(-)